MIPVVTPEEMAAVDAAAPEPVEVLVDRAGAAVARAALDLLGGAYGRRVVVVAGPGNNGADARAAAERLRRRGVRTEMLTARHRRAPLPPADLVIDGAFGTGYRGRSAVGTRNRSRPPWTPPPVPDGTPVLAIDIPSGIDGLTGEAHGRPWAADRTVTFAALKPGLLLGDGPDLAGEVVVVDIGLDVSATPIHVVEDADVARWLPAPLRRAHKWQTACWVVAGSPGLTGAAHLAAAGAQRAGAGYVRLSTPGLDGPDTPAEVVTTPLPAPGWAAVVLDDVDRMAALAVGPGLGTGAGTAEQVRAVVAAADRPPVVVDGDGLAALADDTDGRLTRVAGGPPTVVLTPHDGELARLGGDPAAPDRLAEVRALAARRGAVVLAKGSPTVVADPRGRTLVVTAGDRRLATAGTGDVLTGAITALLAQGLDPAEAAAAAAHLHGRAGARAAAALAGPSPAGAAGTGAARGAAGDGREGGVGRDGGIGGAGRGREPVPWRRGLVAGDVAAHLPAALAHLPED